MSSKRTSSSMNRRELLRTWARYSALAVIAGGGGYLALRRPEENQPPAPWCEQAAGCRSCRSLAGCKLPAAVEARDAQEAAGGDRGK